MATNADREKLITETRASLKRMQDFDASSIARTEELGKSLSFHDGIAPLRRTIDLFQQVSLDVIQDLSAPKLTATKQQADAQFKKLQELLGFSSETANPKQARDALIVQLENSYDEVFEQVWPAVAYSVRRSTDFAKMEREARASIQSIEDRTAEVEASLQKQNADAEAVLANIRRAAAEQGVSQEAKHFKDESDLHDREAVKWLLRTRNLLLAVGGWAVASLLIHKIPFVRPASATDAIQLGLSKGFVFATLGYATLLSSRNFMAHRHNAVVAKHRQNSLATFKTLVDAASVESNRDIVLTKAAECIFGSHATGFSKGEGDDGKAFSNVNVLPSLFRSPPGG